MITTYMQTGEQNPVLNEDLCQRWAANLDASPRTIDAYVKAVRRFFGYLTERDAARPQRETVLAWRDQLKEGHKPATVQSYLAAVKLFFQWTEQEGLYPNIAWRVKGAKQDRTHKKDYLTAAQAARLLEAVDRSTSKGLRDYAMLAVMATTGLRTISVVRANVGDLRPAGDVPALYYQGKGQEEKADYVKLAEPVEEALRAYLAARGDSDPEAPLFACVGNRNRGGRITTRSVSRTVKDRLTAAGFCLDRLTAHSLRHTAATLNLLNGGSIEETQQLLGHSSINTTLIYAHALERAKNNSEQRIAEAIFS